MYSWSLMDYLDAHRRKLFHKNITESCITEMYHYAGGSMRFVNMLLRDNSGIATFKARIAQLFERVETNTLESWFSNHFAINSKDFTINSLVQTFISEDGVELSSLVSSYVRIIVMDKVEYKFIASAKNYNQNNRSYQGWIHEFDFLYRFKTAINAKKNSVKLTREGQLHYLGFNKTKEFKVEFIEDFPISKNFELRNNTLFVPTVSNQGGFDFAYLYSEKTLFGSTAHITFFQLTVASKHTFKYFYCGLFLQSLFPLPDSSTITRSKLNDQYFKGIIRNEYVISDNKKRKTIEMNNTNNSNSSYYSNISKYNESNHDNTINNNNDKYNNNNINSNKYMNNNDNYSNNNNNNNINNSNDENDNNNDDYSYNNKDNNNNINYNNINNNNYSNNKDNNNNKNSNNNENEDNNNNKNNNSSSNNNNNNKNNNNSYNYNNNNNNSHSNLGYTVARNFDKNGFVNTNENDKKIDSNIAMKNVKIKVHYYIVCSSLFKNNENFQNGEVEGIEFVQNFDANFSQKNVRIFSF
jgi:hypothetical protein